MFSKVITRPLSKSIKIKQTNKKELSCKSFKQIFNLKMLFVIALMITISIGTFLMAANNNLAVATGIVAIEVTTPQALADALDYAIANPNTAVDIHVTAGFTILNARMDIPRNVYLYIENVVLAVNGGSRSVYNAGSVILVGNNARINHSNNWTNLPGSVVIGTAANIQGHSRILTGATVIDRDLYWLVELVANDGYITVPSLGIEHELRITFAVQKTPVSSLTLPVDFVVDNVGCQFDGWYTSSEVGGVEWEVGVTPVVEDVILYARWSGSYLVTYDLAGGSGSAPVDSNSPYSAGATVYVLSGVPVRLGYGFDGWVASHDGGLYVGGDGFVMPAEDVVLVAVWSPVSYVVDYELGGGVLVGGVANPLVYTVEDSFPVSIPYSPFKVGYVFDGWTVSYVDGTSELRVPTLVYGIPAGTTGTVALTANWSPRIDLGYVVNYYKDSVDVANFLGKVEDVGTFEAVIPADLALFVPVGYQVPGVRSGAVEISAVESANVVNVVYSKRTDLGYVVNYLERGTDVVLAAQKVVDNQRFGDEVTEFAKDIVGYYVDQVEVTIEVDVEDNVIDFYYVVRSDISYVVHYYLQGTFDELIPDKVVEGQTFGSLVTEQAPVVGGYFVVGGYSQSLVLTAVNDVITFYYMDLNVIYYSISYHVDDELLSGSVPVDGRSPYPSGSVVIVLGGGNMVREGFVFLGWDTSDSAESVVYVGGNSFSLFADVDLYAVWVPAFSVTYRLGEHGYFVDFADKSEVVYSVAPGGLTPEAPLVADESGWRFIDWNPAPSTTVTKDVVYTAQWALVDYTVTYNANDGSSAPVDNAVYHVGDVVTVLSGVPTRAGYTFAGWLYNAAMYRDGDTFVMPATNVMVVAQWTTNTYTVTYAPGAQGIFTSQVHSGLSYGVNTPVFSGAPTGNSGYTFTGWNPSVASTVTTNVTYTAQWASTGSSGGSGGSGGSSGSNKPLPSNSAPVVTDPPVLPLPTETLPSGGEESLFVWALVNLVLSVVGLLLAIMVVIVCVLLQRRRGQEKQVLQWQQQKGVKGRQFVAKQGVGDVQSGGVVEGKKQNQCGFWFFLSVVLGVVGVVVFLLTEDMSRPMALVDKWTIVNAIVFIVEIIAVVLVFRHNKNNIAVNNNAMDPNSSTVPSSTHK